MARIAELGPLRAQASPTGWPLVALALAATLGAAQARGAATTPPPGHHRVPGNLIQNPSFEHDWVHRAFAQSRRFLLLQASDMGVGEADGRIDHWQVHGASSPECWDTAAARSGSRSVRFEKRGQATQLVRFAGEQHWRAGGAYYAMFLPMEEHLADQLARRPIVVGAWCRTRDVPKGAEPQLTVAIECAVRPTFDSTKATPQGRNTKSVAFSGGTHDWEYREVRFERDLDPELDPERLKGTPFFVTVGLTALGGTVWFDDASCVEEPLPTQPNLVANASFETLDRDWWPVGWSQPVLWTWFRNDYYTWTGWSHGDSKAIRGGAVVDTMLAFSGNASLRLAVFPGANFAVESAPIKLDQDKPRPLEVRAMVKADNLRTLEIMAKDEGGQWLPQGDFLGDDMEEPGSYNFGTTGAGTYDWMCVRKYFSPRKPVKTLRLFLCARGFDGRIVEHNLVGTAWLDDIQLFEHGGGKKADSHRGTEGTERRPAKEAERGFRVADIDLGDRLWGRNALKISIEFRAAATREVQRLPVQVSLRSPSLQSKSFAGKVEIVRPPSAEEPTGLGVARVEYTVDELCRSWQERYGFQISIGKGPGAFHWFGTPSRLVEPGVSGYYFYPDEQPVIFANLNVARGSFPELAKCEFVLNGKTKIGEVTDFGEILKPQKAPDYINTRNLAQVRLKSEGFAVHPWNEPVLDNAVVVRLHGKSKLLAETEPIRFGFMARPPKAEFPEKIEKTAVNERGFITINGQPYFPVYWTPHFGVCPEVNYPPTQFKCKAVDLTSIVCSKDKMPDDEVKAKLLAKIAEVRNDPKLFEYALGDGEMQLQGAGWKDRLEWCKKAIGWIREADPNHLINGPQSWLVGHPGHNEAMGAFVPDWDVIGVEASFETVPEIRKFAVPLMKERRTAVLVGLETYFYVPNEVLRWRAYRALLNGATGVGLCPSGMMQSRPDKVNYLRGLNGEFRGLAPVLVADEPKEGLTVSSNLIDTMERVRDGTRFLFAVRNKDDAGPLTARFDFPNGVRYSKVKVRFEGRTLKPTAGGFEDEFPQPQTVHVYELAD